MKIIKEIVFPKSEFVKNTYLLMAGTVISQAIPVIISPVLSRLYSPENYALLALFMGFTGLFSAAATLRYELAIVLPEKEKDAANIVFLSGILTVLIGIISFLAVVFLNLQITKILKSPSISFWLYIAPLSIFLSGVYQTLNYWSIRTKRFANLTASRITQSAAGSGTNLLMGFANLGTAGLITGGLIGQFFSALILFLGNIKGLKDKLTNVSFKEIKFQALKYKDFPRINTLQAFLDMFRDSIIIFMISSLFNSQALGLYSFTLKILKAPASLIGTSVSQVFLQKASEYKNEGKDLKPVVIKMLVRLTIIAVPIFLILFIFSPFLFGLVFGERWTEAGFYARLLSPWLFFNFIFSPISQIPVIMGKQKDFFLFSLLYNLAPIAIFISFSFINFGTTAFFTSMACSQSFIILIIIFWVVKISSGIKRKETYGI